MAGNDVYAGGYFGTAGGSPASFIAKWDGNTWSALGSGVSGYVLTLAASPDNLYAGGFFTKAGGKVSAYAAKAILNLLGFDGMTVANGEFRAFLSGPQSTSVVVDCSATLTDWTPVATNTLPAGGWQLTFQVGTNTYQFYRARFGP